MTIRMYGFAVATAALLGVQAVQAQPMNGCPTGQVMQASDPSGRTVRCVAIPDTGALQGAIEAETRARADADTALFGEISDLRAKVQEQSIAGRWGFIGAQTCLSSSTGFIPGTLNPNFIPGLTILSVNSNTVIGERVFGAPDASGKGAGSSTATFHNITHPTFLSPPAPPPPPPAPPIVVSSPFRTGGASISTLASTFDYELDGDTVILDDHPAVGHITKGFPGTIEARGNPRFKGTISKDRRTILVIQEDMVVEQSVFTPANGAPPSVNDRICHRERTLTKLD